MTPSRKNSKIQTKTCFVFKTVRLEPQAKPKSEPISPKPSRFFTKTGLLCPKDGACSSQKWGMCSPKTEHVLAKNEACFSQKRNMFFPINFSKNGDFFPENGASQSRWLVSPKSVTDFPKVGDRFSQSRWRISPKSVTDFLKSCYLGRFIRFTVSVSCLIPTKLQGPNIPHGWC